MMLALISVGTVTAIAFELLLLSSLVWSPYAFADRIYQKQIAFASKNLMALLSLPWISICVWGIIFDRHNGTAANPSYVGWVVTVLLILFFISGFYCCKLIKDARVMTGILFVLNAFVTLFFAVVVGPMISGVEF
jgi:hypothetical protein